MSSARSSPADAGQASVASNQRACDNCRHRKIKCDKLTPCSGCRASNTACRTTHEKKDPRQRVLISSQYERKIDRIEDRLAGIEEMLRTLMSNIAAVNQGTPDSGISVPPLVHKYRHEASQPPPDDEVPFEGESSLNAHSVFASRLLEQKVGSDVFAGQNPDVVAALASLRNIVSKVGNLNQTDNSADQNSPPNNIGKPRQSTLQLPDKQLVEEFLPKSEEINLSGLGNCFYPFITGSKLRNICTTMYDQETCPLTTQILFYGGLQTACTDYIMLTNDEAAEKKFGPLEALCMYNFESLLFNLPLLMPATIEWVQVLLLGSSHYMELSKPSSCWTLVSQAANICQSLGCHRLSSMSGDSDELKHMKMFLFWSIYIIDKSLSLRLGRSSTIRDDDISIPQPVPGEPSQTPWIEMICHWIKMSKIQSQVYEQLYSPAAFGVDEDQRAERASVLAYKLHDAHRTDQSTLTKDPIPEDVIGIFSYASQVTIYSTLTLIYRAIPPRQNDSSNTFTNECIEAARSSIRAHQACANQYKHKHPEFWAGYVQWAVVNAPFTPFVVIFCHVINVHAPSDLQMLADFVATLDMHGQDRRSGPSTGKLHRLFDVFYRVAKVYVDHKRQSLYAAQTTGTQIPPADDYMSLCPEAEFESYLSQLGMAPNTVYPNAAPENGMDASASLQEWFSGNQYIMGLLEQDLTNIDIP